MKDVIQAEAIRAAVPRQAALSLRPLAILYRGCRPAALFWSQRPLPMKSSFRLALLIVLGTFGSGAPSALAWGGKGHELQARAAVARLPAEMPAFVRDAAEELALLINEPDRWRTSEQPGLAESTGVNHTFKWEVAPRPLPATRHVFIARVLQGKTPDQATGALRNVGTGPYGIQEWAEMLTGAFRRWHAMPESTPAEIARKRMHERSILFIAGVAGHWVTDMSNPMHASVHGSGWHSSMPNPNGYVGRGLHSRYESTYVERAIALEDVTAQVSPEPRPLGNWLRAVEPYIAASNSHVEQIYAWDKEAAFGEGKEPAAAQVFTVARLAEGAQMLRDVWYAAWIRSKAPPSK